MRILARLAAIAAATLALGGCIVSDYDIAADLQPQFPLTAKAYRDSDGKVTTFAVSGNEYLAAEENKQPDHVRFFKIPEYSGYVFQIKSEDTDAKTGKKVVTYTYNLADVTATGFVVRDWNKEAIGHLPERVRSLVVVDKEDNITIKDGRRNTLAVIREMARANLPTKPFAMTAVSAK